MTKASRTAVVTLVAAMLVAAAPAVAAVVDESADGTQSESYAGAHVSFDAESNAVTGYTVGGAEVFSSVEMESRENYENRAGVNVGADVQLSTVTDLQAAGVSLAAQTETRATVESESGSVLEAHDNERGVLQVRAQDGGQLVHANVSGEASAESDDRVVVTTDDGETATVLVVGDGTVDVNEEGDVVAELEEGAQVVVRAYAYDERDDDDENQEQMIANGEAVAEVYAEQRDGEVVADAVTYAENTSVEARQSAENEVEVTVERAESDGKVVITQVNESTVGTVEDLEVQVDGEAAAEASSYSELRAATDGDEPAYLVRQDAAAEGSAQVLVALDHFSERTVTMTGGESTTDDGSGDGDSGGDGNSGGDGGDETDVGVPGFGLGAAVVALLAAVLLARRRA
jgi:PGF-CTERM protein